MISQLIGRRRSFYRQLLVSYLRIAVLAAVFCVVLLTFIFLLSSNTQELNDISIPQTRYLHKISTDVEQTKAALRGWVMFGDDKYKQERQQLWESIHIQLELFEALNEDEEELKTLSLLRKKLADLNNRQWQIEDVARSPENLQAHWLWKRDGSPMIASIRLAIESQLLNESTELKDGSVSKVNLIKILHVLAQISSEMEHYLESGEASSESHLLGYYETLDAMFQNMTQELEGRERQYDASTIEIMTWMHREYRAFKTLSQRVVNIRYSDDWNMMQYWLGKYHLNIEQDVGDLIDVLEKNNQQLITENITKANKLGNRAIFVATLMPMTMFVLIYFLANRNATGLSNSILSLSKKANDMARGYMSGSINIGGTLELDALASAFNRMQNSLKDSHGRLHGVVDTALDAIITINNQGRIESFNKSAEAMFGYSSNDMIGQNISILMAEEDSKHHDQHMRRYLRSGRSKIIGSSREVVAKRRDGAVFPISISVSEMKLSNYHGFTGIIRDLTQDKKRTEQLIEAEKMSALGLMVAGVAHEVNNPLGNAITANSFQFEQLKMIRRTFDENKMSRKNLKDYLDRNQETMDIINNNLYRAAEIVSNFKSVAVDQSSGERRRINLNSYLAEVLHTLYPRYKRTEIDVRYECPMDIMVFTYPGAIFQIISNLVVNSIVHGFRKKKQGNILIRVTSDDANYTIDYTDSGDGVAPEVADKIFEPFVTTRKDDGGSGLGMHIIHNIVVQKLSGTIELIKETQVGIHIQIVLPIDLIKGEDAKEERTLAEIVHA